MPGGEGCAGVERMLSCKEVARILASGALDEYTWGRRLALRLHLLMCRHCRRYARQLRAIAAAARGLWREESEDPSTLERLSRTIIQDSGRPSEALSERSEDDL